MLPAAGALIAAVAGGIAQPRDPANLPLAFEAASVRVSHLDSGEGGRGGQDVVEFFPARLTMRNVVMNTCLQVAYKVSREQIGGAALSLERYDIDAKAAGPVSRDDLRRMLQALLADRFQLRLHRETKELPAYVLTVGKNGHKMRESKADASEVSRSQYRGIRMWEFAAYSSNFLEVPIVDATGLQPAYDFTLNTAPYQSPGGDRVSAFRDAVQDQLGLRVESRRAPVQFLIVDHVEKIPAGN